MKYYTELDAELDKGRTFSQLTADDFKKWCEPLELERTPDSLPVRILGIQEKGEFILDVFFFLPGKASRSVRPGCHYYRWKINLSNNDEIAKYQLYYTFLYVISTHLEVPESLKDTSKKEIRKLCSPGAVEFANGMLERIRESIYSIRKSGKKSGPLAGGRVIH